MLFIDLTSPVHKSHANLIPALTCRNAYVYVHAYESLLILFVAMNYVSCEQRA
jgi:hypothetical protein